MLSEAIRKGKIVKRLLSIFIALCLVIGQGIILPVMKVHALDNYETSFRDVPASAWYSKAVGFIAAKGITTGTGNGNFSPEAKLIRGEFIVMLMRAYGIEPDTDLTENFADSGNTYYTGYLAAAKRLGISGGVGDNRFAPEKQITRQEMFTLLYNALKAIGKLPESATGKSLSAFSDVHKISPWAKDAMTLFVETGTIAGSKGKLAPADTTTRAEMAQVLYSLLSKSVSDKTFVYNKAGIFGPAEGIESINGNVTISVSEVTLKNMTISGDLLLAEGIGNGDVRLENVIVKGHTYIKGGGENSVTLENCTISSMSIDKEGVRVVAAGKTSIKITTLETGAILLEATEQGSGFEKVTTSQVIAASSRIILNGAFEQVDIAASGVSVQVTRGKIERLNITESAKGATISIAESVSIEKVDIEASVQITGSGDISEAVVSAVGVTIAQLPEKVTVKPGLNASVGGQTVSGAEQTSGGSGSGGGSAGTGVTGTNVETTPGADAVSEVNTLTILSGALQTGTIGLTFNDGTINKTLPLVVEAGKTASDIAAAIQSVMETDVEIGSVYTVTNPDPGNTVVIVKNTAGAVSCTINISNLKTGTIGSKTQTTSGANAVPEVNTLTISGDVQHTGTIGLSFNDGTIDKTVPVVVETGDTASEAAERIRAALQSDSEINTCYLIENTQSGNTLMITKRIPGAASVTIMTSDLNTGVRGASVETVQGTNAVCEVNTLTMEGAAALAGTIELEFDDGTINKTIPFDVLKDETASQVASAMQEVLSADSEIGNAYEVTHTGSGAVVVLKRKSPGAATLSIEVNNCNTGVTGTNAENVQGTNAIADVSTLAITGSAVNTGTVCITFNDGSINKAIPINIAAGRTADQIAADIQQLMACDNEIGTAYTVTNSQNKVVFTRNTPGTADVTIAVNNINTGVSAFNTEIVPGENSTAEVNILEVQDILMPDSESVEGDIGVSFNDGVINKTVTVHIVPDKTKNQVAGLIRDAMAADSEISSAYTVTHPPFSPQVVFTAKNPGAASVSIAIVNMDTGVRGYNTEIQPWIVPKPGRWDTGPLIIVGDGVTGGNVQIGSYRLVFKVGPDLTTGVVGREPNKENPISIDDYVEINSADVKDPAKISAALKNGLDAINELQNGLFEFILDEGSGITAAPTEENSYYMGPFRDYCSGLDFTWKSYDQEENGNGCKRTFIQTQENELTITQGAANDGYLDVSVNNRHIAVPVSSGQTPNDIADRIRAKLQQDYHVYNNYSVIRSENKVRLRRFIADYVNTNVTIHGDGDIGISGVNTETEPGKNSAAEANRITVSSGAAASGYITAAINDGIISKSISVPVEAFDSPEQVAGKIRAAMDADGDIGAAYTITASGGNTVLLTKKTPGSADVSISISDTADTGISAAHDVTTNGADPVAEINTLTVTSGAAASGHISVEFDDGTIHKTLSIPVAAADSGAQVAAKIQAAMNADADIGGACIVTNSGDNRIVFEKRMAGSTDTSIIMTGMPDTGITGSSTETISGADAIAEVNTLAISSGAEESGHIGVVFNDGSIDKTVSIEVEAYDSAVQVAEKIQTAMETDPEIGQAYRIVLSDKNLIITREVTGAVDVAISLEGATNTGTACYSTETIPGADAVAEVNTLVISSGAAVAGHVSVIFNDGSIDKTFSVAVEASDSAAQVAGKIHGAMNADDEIRAAYGVTLDNEKVVFTKLAAGAAALSVTLEEVVGTGVSGVNEETTPGEDGVAEINTLTIGSGANRSGTVSLTFKAGRIDKTISVSVSSGDTATQIAEKVQRSIALDAEIGASYTVTHADGSNSVVFTNKSPGAVDVKITIP